MWTKCEFPTERVNKLMENDKAASHELIHTCHPLTTFRRSKQEVVSKCLRRNNNNIIYIKKGKDNLNFLICWPRQYGAL